MVYRVLLCFFLLANLIADERTFLPPHARSHSFSPKSEIKGIVLLSKIEELNLAGFDQVHGILNYHLRVPGSTDKLFEELNSFIGDSLTIENLNNLKKQIISHYQSHGLPLVLVHLPQQDISNGTVQIVVQESKLEKIEVKGNKWFKTKSIEKQIQLEIDETIAPQILDQDLYWLNRNPFRQIDAIYTPGEKPGTTDIELMVHDRFPLRIYGGIDNAGNDVTGNNRLFVGLDWGQVFWTDQRLSYQFATATDFKRFQAHTLFYEVPLPWRNILNLYGGYSHVDADFRVPNITGTKFHTEGFSVQASLRYDIPLHVYTNFLHQVTWGFDFKRTNNNLDLGGRPIISQNNVNLTQLMLGYNLGYEVDPLTISFEIEGFWSPGKWVSDQTNTDYQSLRAFSKNQYIYARSALALIWKFYKEWAFHTNIRWQWASINLLPSEEYGVGGYDTVRGYKERLVNGDNVFIFNLEARTPSVSILNALAGWKKFNDAFQVLVFFDYGFQQVKQPVQEQSKSNNLLSIGPGVRYNIFPYLTFRADWGFQLHRLNDPSIDEGPSQRISFSLAFGY